MSINTASTDNQLKDFFLRELSALREDAAVFAQSHPQAAQALALNRGRSHDPHVEMLIQSFAYLTGRLQYQLEINQAALPGALLSILYPHLEAPLPSMLIARADVRPDNASFAKGVTLARHRHVQTTANDSAGRKLTCRFRT
ncbi:MAG: type VI secretion system baseplate subunit TssF, partial [Betaproteobacteria bacterium]|nr:type VI secretion system baseplate subunit TssF [Betaproteobacteria bacterium]